MKNKKPGFGLKSFIAVAVISLIVGIFVTMRFDMTELGQAGDTKLWQEPGRKAKKALKSDAATSSSSLLAPVSFADLAQRLTPAVVNISSTQVIKEGARVPFPEFRSPFLDEFFGKDFFKHKRPKGEFKRPSLGSGFIINKEGYIITNHHVIEDASEIVVTLSNSETRQYEAEVIGSDAKTDIALIKIESDEDLPVVALGDSDSLRVGEWVIAIGNPFGLGGTVTAGIVSQKGRVIGAGPYDDFIQTDASINPGNSGGPLFNLKGEVVGINTAIIAGGSGIGFAVPVDMAKQILPDLKKFGKAKWGWIGVAIQELNPELAESFGLKDEKGVLIASVIPGDPADKAGMEPGDILLEFDGHEVNETRDLQRVVGRTTPGNKSRLLIVRDGKEKTIIITIGKQKDGMELVGENGDGDDGQEPGEESAIVDEKVGLTVEDITASVAERWGFDNTDGALVKGVKQESIAEKAGIRRGDVIKEINRKSVKNVRTYNKAMKEALKGKTVLFRIKRGPKNIFVAVRIDK